MPSPSEEDVTVTVLAVPAHASEADVAKLLTSGGAFILKVDVFPVDGLLVQLFAF